MSKIRARRRAASDADNPVYIERSRAIQRAAGEVFREKGFHATKLGDIAERVGMDRASLYYYVGSKDELFRSVVENAVEANVTNAEKVAAADMPAREKLRQLITLLMLSFEEHYPYLYVFVQEDPNRLSPNPGSPNDPWKKTLEQSARYYTIFRSAVAEGLESGEISSKLPPSVIANSIIGMLNSTRQWFQPNGVLSAAEIASGLAALVIDGLKPADATSAKRV